MIRLRALLCASVVILTTVASCHDGPTAPQFVQGTYVLRSISGAPLPFTYPSAFGGTITILADTVQLDASLDAPIARVTQVFRITGSTYGPDTTYHAMFTGFFRLSGRDRVEIARGPCPPDADCTPNDTGRVVSRGLVVGRPQNGTWSTWTYSRIGDASQ